MQTGDGGRVCCRHMKSGGWIDEGMDFENVYGIYI